MVRRILVPSEASSPGTRIGFCPGPEPGVFHMPNKLLDLDRGPTNSRNCGTSTGKGEGPSPLVSPGDAAAVLAGRSASVAAAWMKKAPTASGVETRRGCRGTAHETKRQGLPIPGGTEPRPARNAVRDMGAAARTCAAGLPVAATGVFTERVSDLQPKLSKRSLLFQKKHRSLTLVVHYAHDRPHRS